MYVIYVELNYSIIYIYIYIFRIRIEANECGSGTDIRFLSGVPCGFESEVY
jgi:hypothetical protein